MEEIKRKLVESGVIGRVVDDFNPRLALIVFYGDKRIHLGDEVTLAEVQRKPTCLDYYSEYYSEVSDLDLDETSANPELVALVMTEPDAPGGEYLHWLTVPFLATEHDLGTIGLPWMERVAYEPPRSGAHMLVFTLFKVNGFQSIPLPNSRENFSTRAFVHTNALGSPLGASFFNIKYENEDENDGSESSTCISGSCNKRGSTSNLKEIPETSSRRRTISVSLGRAFSTN